ncbi:MAG: CCA tRNA nucleotidyltransferase, partial [Candidatus Zixiibacteriota bacterium]
MSLQTIDAINNRGRIYEVGGVVRDRLFSGDVVTKDRDYLVTGIPYNELSTLLSKYGRVDLVGRSFGVIKFTQFNDGEAHTFDISLPRNEISTGPGHRDFEVSFDPELPVEEDLGRRDFTVNAMAVDLATGRLIDPLGGRDDLERGQLRMVSDNSFVEDPLRMVRAVQFAARFDLSIEEATLAAMNLHAELIGSVSQERIAEEIAKLLTRASKPSIGLRLMQEAGLLSHVIPELETCVAVDQPGSYHKYDVFEHTMHIIDCCRPQLRLRLAALFHDITKPQHKQIVEKGATFYGHESSGARTARQVMRRLHFSNDLISDVQILVERHMFTTDVSQKGMRRLIRRVGVPLIFDLLDLRRADVVAQ